MSMGFRDESVGLGAGYPQSWMESSGKDREDEMGTGFI